MLYVSDSLEMATQKCIVCQKLLDAKSLKPRTCTNEMCEYVFEEGISGSVLSELK